MMHELPKTGQSDQLERLIEGVNNGIRRLRSIVNDMIDVSLIDNNNLSLNLQPIWINQILGLIRNELENSISNRSQIFDLRSFPGSDQMLLGDSERLYQAFRNILSNAIKFTPDGGKIIVDGRTLLGFQDDSV